jgi:hypothetical protein
MQQAPGQQDLFSVALGRHKAVIGKVEGFQLRLT